MAELPTESIETEVVEAIAEVDPYPTADLQPRYGIGKTMVNERLNALGIERLKHGTRTYVSLDDLKLLDALHDYMEHGGQMNDFLRGRRDRSPRSPDWSDPNTAHRSPDRSEPTSNPIARSSWGLLNAPVQEIAMLVLSGLRDVFAPLPPAKRGLRLAPLRELEEAYRNGWLLSSAEVADLLGLQRSTITRYGQHFTDRGFEFTRTGSCKGGQIAWRIDKPAISVPAATVLNASEPTT